MKNALVVRLGANGDLIMASTILPQLKEQGYNVTFLAQGRPADVLRANPYIDQLWTVEKGQIPVNELQQYLLNLSLQFRKYVELNASIERVFLRHKDEPNYHFPDDVRAKLYGDGNYLDYTCDVAGVERRYEGARFYATEEEIEQTRVVKADIGAPAIAWALSGSAVHKIWPYVDAAACRLLTQTDANIVLMGAGHKDRQLADAVKMQVKKYVGDASRIIDAVDTWSIREAYAFACHGADLVVGPETGLLNACGVLNVPKVVFLTHSTHANLCQHWRNVTSLEPDDVEALARCRHRMHLDDADVPTLENGIPRVTASLPIERVVDAVKGALGGARIISVDEVA